MKIKVSLTRVFDISDEHAELFELFESIDDKNNFALHLFAEDVDFLVKYNEVKDQALLEVIE